MKYEKGKWYNFTIKSECECAAEAVARYIRHGQSIDFILKNMHRQLEFDNPFWLPKEWYKSTIMLCVTDAFLDGVIRLSTSETDGYYIPVCFIKEATEV